MKGLKAIVAILVLVIIVEGPRASAKNNPTPRKLKLESTTLLAQVNAKDAHFYFNQGLVRAKSGDIKGAIEDFNQAIRINPNYAQAYIYRSATRIELGDIKGAIEDCNQALRIHPNYAEAYIYRSAARIVSGDIKGAIEDWIMLPSAFNYLTTAIMLDLAGRNNCNRI